MRERTYVKFRSDMYDGTKFKIIDMKPERDLIHYVWTRIVTLAGKVNFEGDLYLSRNISYTIETLAIEFNRGIDQIKLALATLIELEMIELTVHNIYRVKNFAKHQNIKVKEIANSKDKDKEEATSIKEVQVQENSINEIDDTGDKKSENIIRQNKVDDIKNDEIGNFEIINKDINKVHNNINNEKLDNNLQDKIPILLEANKTEKINKKKKKDIYLDNIEEIEECEMFCLYEGEIHLGEGESIIQSWSFD